MGDNSLILHKRTVELEAIRSLKKKIKEKQDKAKAELEEFFNRDSDTENQDSDDELNSILERRSQIKLYTKDGKRRKRFGELDSFKSNSMNKNNNQHMKQGRQKTMRPRINFENYSITHVIGKGASAVVKLGTHNTK